MAKLKGVILTDTWPGLRDSSRLSLKQLDELIQSHLTRIAKARHSLQISCALFKRKEDDILPSQCKKAIVHLEDLNKCVGDFCELFNDPARLPAVYIALRYRLMSLLYLIEEWVCELTDLIESFREVCMTSSRDVAQQRRAISDAFETLLQQIDDIFQRAEFLSHEARFQEQQLTAGLEEKLSSASNSKNSSSSDRCPFYVSKKQIGERKQAHPLETE